MQKNPCKEVMDNYINDVIEKAESVTWAAVGVHEIIESEESL